MPPATRSWRTPTCRRRSSPPRSATAWRSPGEGGPGSAAAVQYADPLASLIELRAAEIQLEVKPDWPRFNPSITVDGDGYRAIVRTANYELAEEGYYRFLDAERRIRTLNYLAGFDDAAVADEPGGRSSTSRPAPSSTTRWSRATRTCALVEVAGRWYALATVRDRNPENVCEIAC